MINDTLVEMLARTDAIFVPVTKWNTGSPWSAGAYQARQAYRVAGLEWRSGATTGAGRQAAHAELKRLRKAGLIESRTLRGERFPRVRLVAPDSIRVLCGLPTMLSAWLVADRLRAEAGSSPRAWISERRFDYPNPGSLILSFLPALSIGYVESGSDMGGRVAYRLTPAGLSWVTADAPAEPKGKKNDEMMDLYDATFAAALEQIKTSKPANTKELGYLPLPVGTGCCGA